MKTTMTDDAWIEYLTVELRLRRVSGPAIGDAVASVRELLADSGQSAEEAFGPAREYAASLDLPTINPRDRALRIVCLPVLGIFTFLAFTQAGTAWFNHDLVLLSVPQVLLLAVPLILTLMFTFPFYPRAVVRQRWLPVVLIVVAGAAGALATLFAPASPPDAWLVFSALPLLIATAAVLVILAAIGTVATVWSQDDYEIVDPVKTRGEPKPRRGSRPVLVAVNWIFPVLALAVFAMTWGLSLLRS